MEGAFRNNERQPDPEKLASIYAKQFFEYYDANPNLGLKCFVSLNQHLFLGWNLKRIRTYVHE